MKEAKNKSAHKNYMVALSTISAAIFILFVWYNICYIEKLNIIRDSILKIVPSSPNTESEIAEIKKSCLILQENFNSLTIRFNDLYILGGTIVILLLTITVSAYLKIESEVDKHMKTRAEEIDIGIDKNKETIQKYMEELGKLLEDTKIKAATTIKEVKNNPPNNQPPRQGLI
jgi:hypothetical protein